GFPGARIAEQPEDLRRAATGFRFQPGAHRAQRTVLLRREDGHGVRNSTGPTRSVYHVAMSGVRSTQCPLRARGGRMRRGCLVTRVVIPPSDRFAVDLPKTGRCRAGCESVARLGSQMTGERSRMQPNEVRTAADAAQIVHERGVRHVKLGVFDMDGVLRGKYLAAEKFLSALDGGFGFCDVVLGWDSSDQLYDNVSFTGWHTAYPDAQC